MFLFRVIDHHAARESVLYKRVALHFTKVYLHIRVDLQKCCLTEILIAGGRQSGRQGGWERNIPSKRATKRVLEREGQRERATQRVLERERESEREVERE